MLGSLIEALADDTKAVEIVDRLGDPGLAMALRAVADDLGVSLAEYASWAVRAYADQASADDWTTLLGALDQSPAPAREWLRRALTTVVSATERPSSL